VWNFRKCAVRHCDTADRKRGPIFGGLSIVAEPNDAKPTGGHHLRISHSARKNGEVIRLCARSILHVCANIPSQRCLCRVCE
jgi:hypothetical protein